MKRRALLKQLGLGFSALSLAKPTFAQNSFANFSGGEKIATGRFTPDWASLEQYQVPKWFQDAKFGMWAHWGPQCQAEAGDWYARGMYQEGDWQYKYHVEKFGHPSKFGFKDIIHEWKAEKWNPDELVTLYKNTGAKYFIGMANHHDNFDMYDSKYQSQWNSTKMGPKKDIIAGWAKAAKANNLPFGVSIHASHAWRWYESAQRSDKNGALAGVPYDGKLRKSDGKGQWWEGLDPQDLYAQNHDLSENSLQNGAIHKQWEWENGANRPSKEYIEKFVNRTIDLINKYDPDLLYFDDTKLPFWPISDAGLRIAAHHYNMSIKRHGELRAVINGKILDENERKAMVWDIERGQASDIQPFVWQTDTCIGSWHYDRGVYNRDGYKSAKSVIHALVDIVSKNGNYLLNVPVRGDGSIDEKERKIVEEIGRWMAVNSGSIYGTRPWKIYGEGPSTQNEAKLNAQGFNEGKTKYTAEDIRFNTLGNTLFATVMDWPSNGKVVIKSLAQNSPLHAQTINKVEFLGNQNQALSFERLSDGLHIQFPENKPVDSYANVLKIS
ncbi:alpha-L-fucosidase [Flectobacillus rivi]|uniref:alpha-L-fucosidase n=1 Tax=Flectobacillus rivi TaxID=2984209 RepID=A0ABT6Z108_9BACT|nr:alpha-L-fucosidase [Flectobacillus rivi]MDI9874806.1 alpha-L-fucosidase [Flectobacillus rivi]